jgi:hypothetical protein
MSGYPVSQSFTLQWYGTKMNDGNVWYHASGSGNPTGNNFGNGWETLQTGSNKTLYTWVQTNWGGTGGPVASAKLYINDSIFWSDYDQIIFRQYEPFQVPNIPWQFGYSTFSSVFDPDTKYLSGSASDILLYNRPLDVSEIANNYKYFQTLPNNTAVPSILSASIDYLIVAGGGGGGTGMIGGTNKLRAAGGGGAGGLLSSSVIISRSIDETLTYPVIIGNAGAVATNGTNSSFYGFTSIGGGRGEGSASAAGNGGSGGGAVGANGSIGTGTAGQGFNGGQGENGFSGYSGGGGGGAKSVGETPTTIYTGGLGGSGSVWLDGKTYAVGGQGGNGLNSVVGSVGNGIAGNGGGGGALTSNPGTAGTNGIVIVRYPGTSSIATGGTITFSGSYTYHTFTSSGDFIY